MGSISSSRWELLEQLSPTLFLAGGGSLVVHAVHHGLEAFVGIEYPLHHEVPFGVAGMILGFIALLGLYPKLADRTPKLSGAGAVLAVFGAVGWFVLGVTALAEELGVEPPAWLDAFGLLIIGGVILGYLTFSIASLRTDIVSRVTGLVLLTPLLVMVMNISIATAGYGSLKGQFAVSSGFAVAHLAIGVALRSEDIPADSAEPVPVGTIRQ